MDKTHGARVERKHLALCDAGAAPKRLEARWDALISLPGPPVGAGAKLTPLRRLRIAPPWALAEASGGLVSLARSLSIETGRRACLTWSAGPSCAGSISFVGSRSRSSTRRTGSARTRSGGAACGCAAGVSVCRERPSKLDPFKEEIHELLRARSEAARGQGPRADRAAGLRWAARRSSMTICARCARCSCAADVSAHDLSARRDLPVRSVAALGAMCRSVTARRGGAMSSSRCLGYSRVGAGALIFSKQAQDVLWGIARCLWSFGALPRAAGLGSRGVPARRRRTPDRRVCRRSAVS